MSIETLNLKVFIHYSKSKNVYYSLIFQEINMSESLFQAFDSLKGKKALYQ